MSPPMLWFCLFLSLFTALVRAQGPLQTFFPSTIPLVIRNPYMSVWHPSLNTSAPLSSSWPFFWGQQSIMGWAGKIQVDKKTYAWMGQDGISDGPANVTNIQITPTRTIFVMQAGPMNVNITFLSPIEPSDWVKQSIPFAYVSLEAASLDGASHSVQVYSDISAEWVSGNRSSQVTWSSHTTASNVYHEILLQNPEQFVEIANQAQDDQAYYAMATRPGLTWQIGGDVDTRTLFRAQGSLNNVASTTFAPISPNFSVFAIAVDLGHIQSTPSPVTWTVGVVRDPTLQYTTLSGGTEQRRPMWRSEFPSISSLIDSVTGDFASANDRAVALDNVIMSNASTISPQYVDLVSLATRQTMGSMDFTVLGLGQDGINASDVKIFMKDIGTSGRVSPVERIYAAFPMLIYLNASIAGGLLRPLLESQDGLTDQQFAAQDLGTTYPLAQGAHGVTSNEGIEESGNLLIMLYAHARFSGDGSLLNQHYNTTKRWADYLVNTALTPNNQQTADNENIANMTNLALKGIIGVKAMAEISRAVGQDFDAQQYDSHASALIGSWQSLATSANKKQILDVYGNQESSTLLYNLYPDLLLGTHLVPQSIVDLQTQFYATQLPTAAQFGLPIDSTSGTEGSAAWTLFTSATVSDDGVRNSLIESIWARTSYNQTPTPAAFYDVYDVSSAVFRGGNAGPAVGAMFSHLALTVPNTTININGATTGGNTGSGNNGSNNGKAKQSDLGPIVGGVIGGVAVITIAIVALVYFRRRRRNRTRGDFQGEKVDVFEGHQPSLSSYYYQNPATGSLHGSDYVVVPNTDGTLPYTRVSGGLHAAEHGAPAQVSQNPLGLATNPPTGRPSKAREVARNNTYYVPESVSGSSAVDTIAPSASSREPLSPNMSDSQAASLSPTDVLGLRSEVENLRRVMQEIRAERFEPPPEYA